MSKNLIRYSAFSYMQQWYSTDRDLMGATNNAKEIQNLATKYMVSRNFKSSNLTKAEIEQRWESVVKHVSATKQNVTIDTATSIHELANKLGKIFPTMDGKAMPVLLSAASKFLWFSGMHEVRIYDKRAVTALNLLQKKRVLGEKARRSWRVDGSYADFAKAWDEEYEVFANDIIDATKALDNVLEWSILPEGNWHVKAMQVASEQWFLDRVFDKYLWTIGESNKGGLRAFM